MADETVKNLVDRSINDKDDKDTWDELCMYVFKNILEYTEGVNKFPKYLALKLKGLKYGQFIANNKVEREAKYNDYVLLIAFKLYKAQIVDYLHTHEKMINDERHKINIITKMIEPKLNDTYLRLQRKERSAERINDKDYSQQSSTSQYHKQKEKELSEKMKSLF